MIPCADPRAQYLARRNEIAAAVAQVLDRGQYILGEDVERFERAFAAYCQTAHAVGVANGTDALTLALRALGIGPGDEVITVSHTALATVAGVLAAGAVPVLVDVEPDCFTLDPARLEEAATDRTKAIVAVHLYGQAADLEAIAAFARPRGLKVIEDCAQATGATFCGRPLGAFGDAACYSFYPTKNLGAIGDGGAVVTPDADIAARVRRLRQYGWDEKRQTDDIGVNSRLDAIQAGILSVKLPHLDADNRRRAEIAARYEAAFFDLPLTVPAVRPGARHVYHLYVIQCDDRDALRAALKDRKIETGIHYPVPAHLQGGYAGQVRVPLAGLPVTERLAGRVVSLPMFPELDDREVDRVIETVRAYFRS